MQEAVYDMRKTVLHNIPAQQAKEAHKKEYEAILCDIDEKQIGYKGVARYYRCEICTRELCRDHTVRDYHHSDDYASTYCEECFEKYEPARKQMEERHDTEETQLINRIKEETLHGR